MLDKVISEDPRSKMSRIKMPEYKRPVSQKLITETLFSEVNLNWHVLKIMPYLINYIKPYLMYNVDTDIDSGIVRHHYLKPCQFLLLFFIRDCAF